jgi:hypothetical protein
VRQGNEFVNVCSSRLGVPAIGVSFTLWRVLLLHLLHTAEGSATVQHPGMWKGHGMPQAKFGRASGLEGICCHLGHDVERARLLHRGVDSASAVFKKKFIVYRLRCAYEANFMCRVNVLATTAHMPVVAVVQFFRSSMSSVFRKSKVSSFFRLHHCQDHNIAAELRNL